MNLKFTVKVPESIPDNLHANNSTVEPRLSESPLSKPSVIQTLFRILKSLDFLQNQVINEMPV